MDTSPNTQPWMASRTWVGMKYREMRLASNGWNATWIQPSSVATWFAGAAQSSTTVYVNACSASISEK
ncbi:hypothetical protein D3C83_148050 [compost metagenome]